MTTEAQRLAELIDTHDYFLDDVLAAAALLRRQEAALMLAREALENVRKYDKENLYGLDDDIAAINELLGEQT